MRTPWRITLIWLLMLALPAQAMAASVMQACHALPSSVTTSLPGMAAHHGAAEHHATSSHHATSTDQPAADSGTCSLCAGCVGAALLNSAVPALSPWQASEPSLTALGHFNGFIADTPERPPRLSFI